jgi:Histidine kinase
MKNKTGLIILHLTGCVAFLSLPVLLSPDVSWDFGFLKMHPFQEEFITYTLLLIFFYFNYFSFIPDFYFKQKFYPYTGFIVISYAIIAFLPHYIIPDNHATRQALALKHTSYTEMPPSPNVDKPPGMQPTPANAEQPGKPPPNEDGFPGMKRSEFMNSDTGNQLMMPPHPDNPPGRNSPGGQPPQTRGLGFLLHAPHFEYLFQFMMVLVLSTMIRINNRLKQTEKEKVNAELSYLKAQINPHFLFNTLNSIYSSAIDENAENTATAIVKLSGMMRYVINEAHHHCVPLPNELNYISDYIELQKLRLGSTVHLLFGINGNAAGKQIAPLILISFIENAFKYGVNPEENSVITIEIDIHNNDLLLSVLNNKVKTPNADRLKNNIGLENTRNRLQLIYPSRHELAVKEDEKEYLVLLKINL